MIHINKKKSLIQLSIKDFIYIKKRRRRPTLPHSHPCSTIGAEELNYRVRNGNGWSLFAMVTEKYIKLLTI